MAERSIKEYVVRKGAAKRIPVSGTFELTSRCNLNCKMCYIHTSPEEQDAMGRELTTEEWLRVGREAVAEGMIYLLLTGGEPLLRPDFLTLYTEMIRMGVLISINTNGTRITPEVLDCFQKYKPEKVNITLYGMSDASYTRLCGVKNQWETVLANIRALKEAGIRVNLNTTFTRYNIGDMEAIVDFAKAEGIPVRMSSFIFPPVRNQHEPDDINLTPEEMGKAAARFDRLTMNDEQLEKRMRYVSHCLEGKKIRETDVPESRISSCMAGRGAFWISWDGYMYPCGMLSDFHENIRSCSMQDAWRKTCETVKQMYLPPECSVCKYQPLCPSCAAVSQCCNGRTDALVPAVCTRTKTYADAFLHGET